MIDIYFEFNSLSTPVILKRARDEPRYRAVLPGLSFYSKCKNPACAAYNDAITVNRGLGHFNIGVESMRLKCPLCGNKAEHSTNCGFCLTQWRFTGLTQEGEQVEI